MVSVDADRNSVLLRVAILGLRLRVGQEDSVADNIVKGVFRFSRRTLQIPTRDDRQRFEEPPDSK